MRAVHTKVEYLVNPLGLGCQKPRIEWCLEGGKKQTGYRLKAYHGNEEIYDSCFVETSRMEAEYPLPLSSRERVELELTVYDEEKQAGEPTHLFFEMGLLHPSDYKASWITGSYRPKKKVRYPVDCFKKEFELTPSSKGRLYITATGLYHATINGKEVTDAVLTPGSTDLKKRVQVQTYDVTSLLQEGKNTLEIELADGWFRGSSGSKGRLNTYGKVTRVLAQLEVLGEDGKETIVKTDESFSWSNDGSILFADLKDGEKVDLRKTPSYSGHAKLSKWDGPLTNSDNVLVKQHERFKPVRVITTPSGKTVLEFEQNLSGVLAFDLKAKEGQKIFIRLGEMLDDKGEFTQKNIQCTFKGKQSPLQELEVICKEGENHYCPKFFYGGFRYALIETDIPFEKDDFTQIAIYSDFEETSTFDCSHPLINQFYKNTLWSLKSNSTDFPSDCPTRERMGWTGDSQVFFNTASTLTDYASFARKHLNDIYDRQWRSGRLPQIAPYANEDWFMATMNGSIGWACAGVYIPYNFYLKYGDKKILEDHYEGMIKYAKFMIKRAGKWGGVYAKPLHISHKNRKYAVNAGQSYGEWAEPNDVMAFQWFDFAAPHPEESTAYTYYTLLHILKVADILGKQDDPRLAKIKEYSDGAKIAYQEMVTKERFTLDTDRQAKLVRPLYMDLLTPEQTEFAKKRLIEALDHYHWRLGTGFLSTPFILDVLADIDIEYAYKLLENEECPGWLFMPKSGATTVWEAWEGNTTPDAGLASLNHYSKGAMVDWLYHAMLGIKVDGENAFVLKPRPGGSITHAEGSYRSRYGEVKSSWVKEGEKTSFSFTVPVNCTAKIELPDGSVYEVEAGTYSYTI